MLNQELLKETLETANLECWKRERTANTLTGVAVRLHATECSLRETQEILRFVDCQLYPLLIRPPINYGTVYGMLLNHLSYFGHDGVEWCRSREFLCV